MQNGFATRGGALLVALCAGVPQLVAAADKDVEQVIVSASRVPEAAADLALPWTLVDGDAISTTAAVHINQLTQRVPGTWISRGNGQESLPALRSPVFTGAGSCGAFYMAWDGLSLRGPGFCNVNQLFDANSEQAGRIEVLRGPGAAVYGANAVHGVLNVLTPSLDDGPARRLALEGGANDYYRGRLALRGASGVQSLGLFANVASDGGYKDESGYEQQKLTVKHRYDGDLWTVTSALEATNLQQETAGFVTGFEAYRDPASRPANPNPEAYRDSYAVRAYSRFTRSDASRTLAITPYLRRTGMQFLQHFLPWQPVEKNGQDSVGLRLQLNGDEERLRWQSGIDADLTRGWLREVQDRDFSPNQPAGVHYDYTVDACPPRLSARSVTNSRRAGTSRRACAWSTTATITTTTRLTAAPAHPRPATAASSAPRTGATASATAAPISARATASAMQHTSMRAPHAASAHRRRRNCTACRQARPWPTWTARTLTASTSACAAPPGPGATTSPPTACASAT
jgi:outer membrane receptor protein involved in Fe transport